MSDLAIYVITALIASLCGFIGMAYALKRFDFYEVLVDSFDALLADEQNLAKVYALGQLIGRGLADGTGLGKIKKGGGKIFGIPSELVLPFLEKFGILPKTEAKTSESVNLKV